MDPSADPMEAIRQTFFQECEELLADLEAGLMSLQDGDGDDDTINAVFRAAHSIKGGAGAFGLDDLVRFAHVFETTLDMMRSGALAVEPAGVAVMLRAADVLADHVAAAKGAGAVAADRSQASVDELQALAGAEPDAAGDPAGGEEDDFGFTPLAAGAGPLELAPGGPAPAAAPATRVRVKPFPAMYAKANDAFLLLRELGRLGPCTVELDAAEAPPLEALDPDGAWLSWNVRVEGAAIGDVRDVFEFVEGDCELDICEIGAGPEAAAPVGPEPDIAALLARAAAPAEVAPPALAAPEAVLPGPVPTVVPAPAPPAGQPAAAAPGKEAAAVGAQSTIRVDLERVDRLIDLVGELVINQAMLTQRIGEAGVSGTSAAGVALEELEQLTREIQDSVMAIRAQPVKSVFQRMPRLVREIAAMTGKQVRLVTEGEGTEVDKTVIERLTDPITHMIRNAVDHGLESTAARIAAGKPAEGVIRLAALHRSGRIVIEVGDDGGGINRERVRSIAVEKGLVDPAAVLTDEEVDNLIFLPGFSTAAQVSDISGRGVGMDVVRRSIQALGGRISIASEPGRGSTFTLSLPLTLAVLDGMMVSAGDQMLIAPLTAIIETLQPKPHEVRRLGPNATLVAVRDNHVPVIDIGVALGWRSEPIDPVGGVALLVESEGFGRAALMVDGIHGQRQVVIKSLEANYQQVPGIAAATILGDGRVALILDVDSIIALRRREAPTAYALAS